MPPIAFRWLWSDVHKGLEIAWGPTGRESIWLGYTPRKWKKLGW